MGVGPGGWDKALQIQIHLSANYLADQSPTSEGGSVAGAALHPTVGQVLV